MQSTRSCDAAPFLLAALLLWPTEAAGQARQCDDRDKVLSHLAKKYSEAPIAAGVTTSGGLVEVLTDEEGGTWTIIVTTPQGWSCLLAAGEGWRTFERVVTEPEA